MKKYRVTEKHPYLKTGISFELVCESADHGYYIFNLGLVQETLAAGIDADWLNNGWIEEIQEPEFIKDDIVEFLEYLLKQNDRHCEMDETEFVNEWINDKNENKTN